MKYFNKMLVVVCIMLFGCNTNNDVKPSYPIEVTATKEKWAYDNNDRRVQPDYNQVLVVISLKGSGVDNSRFTTYTITAIDAGGQSIATLSDKNTNGSMIGLLNVGKAAADASRMEIKYKVECVDKGGNKKTFEGYFGNGQTM